MKTILVPTDFSKISSNAIDYAVEIATHIKAKLILFNVYNFPIVPSEIPTILPISEIEKESMAGLKKIEKQIHHKHGSEITVECKCRLGFAVDEINRFAELNKINLIVMGTEGVGYLTEKLFGNITSSLIKKAKCPVLVIDKHVKYSNIHRIVFACDYNKPPNKLVLDQLKEFACWFTAHVFVLNIVPELETVPTLTEELSGIRLNHSLISIDHSFHHAESEDIIEGINDFVNENSIDLVVMIPQIHSSLQSFFIESNTKRMVFHTKVPLLALQE